jgi:hypothetical protein
MCVESYVARGLIEAAVGALFDGHRVSIKIDAEATWFEVDRINSAERSGDLFEARRVSDGRTLIAPVARLAAIEVSEAAAAV